MQKVMTGVKFHTHATQLQPPLGLCLCEKRLLISLIYLLLLCWVFGKSTWELLDRWLMSVQVNIRCIRTWFVGFCLMLIASLSFTACFDLPNLIVAELNFEFYVSLHFKLLRFYGRWTSTLSRPKSKVTLTESTL